MSAQPVAAAAFVLAALAFGLPASAAQASAAQASVPAAAARAAAGVDVNVATADELQTVRGIGPALAGRIVEERARGPYRDLADLEARVKGVGPGNVRRFAEAGLVVGAGRGRVGSMPAAGGASAGAGAGGSAGVPSAPGGNAAASPAPGGQTMTTTPLGAGVVREYHRPADGSATR
jgi:competence protein ComEA